MTRISLQNRQISWPKRSLLMKLKLHKVIKLCKISLKKNLQLIMLMIFWMPQRKLPLKIMLKLRQTWAKVRLSQCWGHQLDKKIKQIGAIVKHHRSWENCRDHSNVDSKDKILRKPLKKYKDKEDLGTSRENKDKKPKAIIQSQIVTLSKFGSVLSSL